MTKDFKDILARAESWPDWAKQDLLVVADEIDREVTAGTYRAARDELAKIDEAIAAVRRGEVANRGWRSRRCSPSTGGAAMRMRERIKHELGRQGHSCQGRRLAGGGPGRTRRTRPRNRGAADGRTTNSVPTSVRRSPTPARARSRRRTTSRRFGNGTSGQRVGQDSRDLIRRLEADGWRLVGVTGSHHHFKHPVKPGKMMFHHPRRGLHPKTVKSIYRLAGLEQKP